jgi:putative PIN family toxin of toxin-antitoxin system
MKVVLDTNIVVSGLLQSKGNPAQILSLALAGAIQVCTSKEILEEYKEVLARPRFKFDPQRIREVLTRIEQDGIFIESHPLGLKLPDPDDEIFLAVTLTSSSEFLITGNLTHYPNRKTAWLYCRFSGGFHGAVAFAL